MLQIKVIQETPTSKLIKCYPRLRQLSPNPPFSCQNHSFTTLSSAFQTLTDALSPDRDLNVNTPKLLASHFAFASIKSMENSPHNVGIRDPVQWGVFPSATCIESFRGERFPIQYSDILILIHDKVNHSIGPGQTKHCRGVCITAFS